MSTPPAHISRRRRSLSLASACAARGSGWSSSGGPGTSLRPPSSARPASPSRFRRRAESADLVLIDLPASSVAVVTLNRPSALNTLSTELVVAVDDALESLAQRTEIRVALLTGSGNRAFCAGADLKQRDGMSDEEWAVQHASFEAMVDRLRSFDKPVIAVVNGVAAGGGLELAMSCDFIVASETARLGQPEASRGIMPGLGGTQLLPRLVPHGLAAELLLTGRLIDAGEAQRAGLVTHVYPADELLPSAISL